MSNPGPFLSTLAESAAAVVAIVGGFLVSRLVAISSEREGLRRQLGHARDHLRQVTVSYKEAHDYRLANSEKDFTDWVLDDLVSVQPSEVDRDGILEKHIPRGSSQEEMAAHLEHLIELIARATSEIAEHLYQADTQAIDLEDLEERGLAVPEEERKIYRRIVRGISDRLPRPSDPLGLAQSRLMFPEIVSQVAVSTDLRRLDDSIHEEQTLDASKRILEAQVERLKAEISLLGRPVGVMSAIVVLAFYSSIGVVLPVVVMGIDPAKLKGWQVAGLTALFALGLFSVLAYILWYVRTLKSAADADEGDA